MGNVASVWPSPAKINLFLHINGRRPDGYHELQTLFAILDRGDSLEIAPRDDGVVNVGPDLGFPAEDNIVFKAARLLKERTGRNFGADIRIVKRIPIGGGLGGGSSNAATALTALDVLFGLGIGEDGLAELGRTLGADVPVFVRGRSAFAEGVGEKLAPVTIPERSVLVVTPKNVAVSTREIFGRADLPRNTPKIDPAAYTFAGTRNDCEETVKKCRPEVAKVLAWLLQYAPSRMTGTGASCFAFFDSEEAALGALRDMPEDMTGFAAATVNVSPLRTFAAAAARSRQLV